MRIRKEIGLFVAMFWAVGCWEQTEHEYDAPEPAGVDTNSTSDTSNEPSTDDDTATDSSDVSPNSLLGPGWAGFGTPCEEDAQCAGYPSEEKRCIQNVLGIIATPGGFCTACCNEPGENVCGPGIDCVGDYNAFLICIARCQTDDDCRTDEHYECHESLYFMEKTFPGKYCLPDSAHSVPEAGAFQDTVCPWPWLDE